MSHHCDLDLDDSKTIFSQDTLAHNDAHHTKLRCRQKVKWFRRYCLDKHWMKFWVFAVTLILNTTKQPVHKTLKLMMVYHETKFGSKRIRHSEDITETDIFFPPMGPATMNIANQFVFVMLQLRMTWAHTKFDYKKFCTSECMIWTNTNWTLNICCDLESLDHQHSNPKVSL